MYILCLIWDANQSQTDKAILCSLSTAQTSAEANRADGLKGTAAHLRRTAAFRAPGGVRKFVRKSAALLPAAEKLVGRSPAELHVAFQP
eukprot:SAG11_NODE_13367_length_658_cov_1.121646_2_plen_88_part_01